MNSKQKINKSSAIIESVSYWLGYQFKIGRDQLIHEASLRYPIADTITSFGVKIEDIELEKLHPMFKGKRIDLVIYDAAVGSELEKDDDKIIEMYEFKIAKKSTSDDKKAEHQRVFDDVVRLAYYHQWEKKGCYFLMCGKYEDFKTYFVGQKNAPRIDKEGVVKVVPSKEKQKKHAWNPNGLYREWFGFKINEVKEKRFEITDPKDEKEWGLKSFQNDYTIRDGISVKFNKSMTIKTTCIAITSPGLENNRTHAAGIWKIESV